jgi:hypothetical protein
MSLKERMRQQAEGSAYRKSVEPMRALGEEIASKARPGYTNPGGYGEFDPEFNAAESTLTKSPLEPLTSLQGFDPARTPPVEFTPTDFQYGEATVAAPRAKAAAAAAEVLTDPQSAAVEPGKPDPVAEAINARKQAESDAYKERMDRLLGDKQPLSSQDKYMALLQASLGTMAAASQPGGTFLGSIGQGGLLGVKQLQEAKASRAERNMKQATLLQSQRSEDLSNEARDRQLKVSERGVEIQGARELREAEDAKINDPIDRAYKKALTTAALKADKPDAFMARADAFRKAMPNASEEDILDRAAGYDSKSPNQYTITKDALNYARQDPIVKALAESPASFNPTPEFTKEIEDALEAAKQRYFSQTGGGSKSPPPSVGGRVKFNDLP